MNPIDAGALNRMTDLVLKYKPKSKRKKKKIEKETNKITSFASK